MSEVIIHEDENFERALKRFKKKCEKAGILSDLRKHRHYEKPSERERGCPQESAYPQRVSGSVDVGGSLLLRLQRDQASARREQLKDRVLLLGMILSDVKNREIEVRRDATDDDVMDVIRKGIKRRRESVALYGTAGRTDLLEKEQREVTALEAYLPAEVDPDLVRAAVREAILAGAVNMGAVMAKVMPLFKGRVEGGTINAIVREELARG